MNNEIVIIVLAHFVADFMLQWKVMAENKWKPGKRGLLWCAVHLVIYTSVMCLALRNFDPLLFAGIFVPHFLIDRYSLAHLWMKVTGMAKRGEGRDTLQIAFGAIVYVVIDQTLHFVSLYVLFYFLNI
jgi:hypothetical protein